MPLDKTPPSPSPRNTNISIGGDVNGNVIVGDNNTVNQTIVQRVTNFFSGGAEQQRAMRIRRALLELVKNTWISGVFEKSIYKEMLIELGLEEHPSAVNHSWDMQVQMPDQVNRTLPAGTSITEVFDEMGSTMLILGEPGSGKTTTLLELARDKIFRADQDETLPIPVLLNLSNWYPPKKSGRFASVTKFFNEKISEQPFADWLIQELNAKYKIPKTTAQLWIERDELLLLLDGLDEIKEYSLRIACVNAINEFRTEHGFLQMIVCSRMEDYYALPTRLNLNGAVILQPLTTAQIDKYFENAGTELETVHQVLQTDDLLQELVRQPLMLAILIMAYKGLPAGNWEKEQNSSVKARRKYLFDTYINQMFRRTARTKNEKYTPNQTKYWLAWIAKRGQSIFWLEEMEESWLQKSNQKTCHGVLVGAICWFYFGIFSGLFVGLFGWLKIGIIFDMLDWLRVELFVGLNAILLFVMLNKDLVTRIILNQEIRQSIKISVIIGFIGVLFFGLIDRLLASQGSGLVDGLVLGPLIGPLLGLYFGGYAVINNYSLRYILYKSGNMPWDYSSFLDYAAERIFLREVDGRYIFVHRLLMEHFADMYQEND